MHLKASLSQTWGDILNISEDISDEVNTLLFKV